MMRTKNVTNNIETATVINVTPTKENSGKKNKVMIAICSIILILVLIIGGLFGMSYCVEKQRYETAKAQASDIILEKKYELDNKEHELKIADFINDTNEEQTVNRNVQFDTSKELVFTANEVNNYAYKIIVAVSDNKMWDKFKTFDLECKVYVVDTTAPEFTESVEEIKITEGESIDVKSKFKASDASGNVDINVKGEIDNKKAGTQTVSVCATDVNGNVANKEVKVVVEAKPKEETITVATNNKPSIVTSSNSSQNGNVKTNKVSTNKTQTDNNSPKKEITTKKVESTTSKVNCTHSGVSTGNCGKWYSSYDAFMSDYNATSDKYNNMWLNDEITSEEYYSKSPSGYNVWKCGQCGKWTGDYHYR